MLLIGAMLILLATLAIAALRIKNPGRTRRRRSPFSNFGVNIFYRVSMSARCASACRAR